MKTSETIVELIAAFTQFQCELVPAPFDSKNPHFKNDYASYASIIETVRPLLAKYNLSFFHGSYVENGHVILVTRLNHRSGQWVESYYPINPVKNDPQGFGSALTYAKRYTLSALLGVVSDTDDDAEVATHRKVDMPRPPKTPMIQNLAPAPLKDPTQDRPKKSLEQEPSSWVAEVKKAAQPNHDPLGDYTPTFGKYKGMKIRDVLVHDLNNYVEYLQKSAAEANKPINKNAAEFISEVKKFLKTRETPKKQAPSSLPVPSVDDINDALAQANAAFMNEDVPF